MKLDPEPGGGTRIRVLLAASCALLQPPPRPWPAPAPVRDLARRILTAAGFEVRTAVNGVGSLESCRSRAGRIELVLLDSSKPRMDGIQVMREPLKEPYGPAELVEQVEALLAIPLPL